VSLYVAEGFVFFAEALKHEAEAGMLESVRVVAGVKAVAIAEHGPECSK
jgi:hypothetical protein